MSGAPPAVRPHWAGGFEEEAVSASTGRASVASGADAGRGTAHWRGGRAGVFVFALSGCRRRRAEFFRSVSFWRRSTLPESATRGSYTGTGDPQELSQLIVSAALQAEDSTHFNNTHCL